MYFRSKEDLRKGHIARAKRVVIKIGSAVLAGHAAEGLDEAVFSNLAGGVSALKRSGKDVVLVTSGAIAIGMKKMGLKKRPVSIPEKQAIAAIGQGSLMALYEKAFTPLHEKVAQVLLTHDDLGNRSRFLNARNTLLTLLNLEIIPIINENDTVAVEEIKFGDNDHLAALVTNLAEADLLAILTDIDGLFDKDPKKDKTAKLIPVVKDVDHMGAVWAGETIGTFGTGGMASKVEAAKKAAHFGVPTIIANGRESEVLRKIFSGEGIGTFFFPMEDKLTSKKHWIAFSAKPAGTIFVDDGARDAILKKGKSLLPSGITRLDGIFETGEVVRCVDRHGKEFARGVVNYSSGEIEKIKGMKTTEIEKILGYKYYDEVVHRDNLAPHD
ncbi:MAG: glutamate 5-kinase [Deltaproteobacteria bacterium]|nr:glutamate 5-kinase [Deltaproteobacteria bacterium]